MQPSLLVDHLGLSPRKCISQLCYEPNCAVITVNAFKDWSPSWSRSKLAKSHLAHLLKRPTASIDLLGAVTVSASPASERVLLTFKSHRIPKSLFAQAKLLAGAGLTVHRYFRNSVVKGLFLPSCHLSACPPTCPGLSPSPTVGVAPVLVRPQWTFQLSLLRTLLSLPSPFPPSQNPEFISDSASTKRSLCLLLDHDTSMRPSTKDTTPHTPPPTGSPWKILLASSIRLPLRVNFSL